MVVNNAVHGDSRVQRVAATAAGAGWEVRVVGRAPGRELQRVSSGGVETVLVPVPPVLAARRGRDTAAVKAARRTLAERDRVAGHTVPPWRYGAWRLLDPWVQDLELALAPYVEELAPHLIHAHDRHTVPLVARSAAVLRTQGRRVAWVLDAHEYVAATAARGAAGPRGRLRRAMVVGEQDEFIRDADAVVTVSRTLADTLVADHRLATPPTVVLNAPVVAPNAGGPSLRRLVGLPEGVPLLVYAGGCAPARGVATLVQALTRLDGVHAALVTADGDPHVPGLLDLAARLGVAGRVHRVPYVPADHVVPLLRSADVGIVPLLHRPNHEISLVTKYLEYLHAGLPVLTSDVREMARFTTAHGLGEVHPAGDPQRLADAARIVLADHDRYAAAVRSSAAVRDTAWPCQAERLLALYDTLLQRG